MSKKFLKGTIIGGLVGAIGGLLLAPKEGKKTRQELKKQAEAYKSQATQKGNEVTGVWAKLSRGFSKETSRYAQRLKNVLHQATEDKKPKAATKKPAKRGKKA